MSKTRKPKFKDKVHQYWFSSCSNRKHKTIFC